MPLWPRRLSLPAAVAVSMLPMSAPAGAETVRLELKRLEDQSPSGFVSPGPGSDLLFRMTYPQSFCMELGAELKRRGEVNFSDLVKKEPAKYQCDQPFQGVANLGSDHYAFVLDASDFKAEGYDQLYFDRNHNGDLTDDEVVKARPLPPRLKKLGGPFTQREFPRVDLTVSAGGEKTEYAFFLSMYSYEMGTAVRGEGEQSKSRVQVSVMIHAAAYRDGDVTLRGKRRRIVVLDFNSNGRFDDELKVERQIGLPEGVLYPIPGDVLLVDPDAKNAHFWGWDVTERREKHYLSRLVNIDDSFYDLKISAAGDTMTLTPSTAPLGAVTNPSGPYTAVVYGDKGVLKISGAKSKPVPLPEGDWKLLSYRIDLTERKESSAKTGEEKKKRRSLLGKLSSALFGTSENGYQMPRYTAVSAGANYDYKQVKVAGGETVPLPFGPPYKPRVGVLYVRSPKKAELGLTLIGSAGESCTDMTIQGRQPPAPSFEITNAKGEVIERGKFEYG